MLWINPNGKFNHFFYLVVSQYLINIYGSYVIREESTLKWLLQLHFQNTSSNTAQPSHNVYCCDFCITLWYKHKAQFTNIAQRKTTLKSNPLNTDIYKSSVLIFCLWSLSYVSYNPHQKNSDYSRNHYQTFAAVKKTQCRLPSSEIWSHIVWYKYAQISGKMRVNFNYSKRNRVPRDDNLHSIVRPSNIA